MSKHLLAFYGLALCAIAVDFASRFLSIAVDALFVGLMIYMFHQHQSKDTKQ
ncbi:MAG: hypothetical protein K2W88_15065 [Pararheinheimera sp.]|nr:hypothetical protein [Rheinheimera sp.]